MTTKRMSEERRKVIAAHLERHGMLPEEYAEEVLAEIDALRAELTAATAARAEAERLLSHRTKNMQRWIDHHNARADDAERERDEARGRLQRQADVYERPNEGWVCYHCGERFLSPGSAEVHFGTRPTGLVRCREMQVNHAKAIREKDEAIAQARADALEEAAKAVEKRIITCGQLDQYDDYHNWGITEAAQAIRALTHTQESETP